MPTVTIEKLVFGGQALGRIGAQVVFLWGALPGETVEFRIIKQKKNFIEGVVTKVLTPSPDRVVPEEKHHLSCSPWSIMSLATENEWKKKIAFETYRKVGSIDLPPTLEIVSGKIENGYRNKIEYSFAPSPYPLPTGEGTGESLPAGEAGVVFAFHERGDYHPMPIDKCTLATAEINKTANEILYWIQDQKIFAQELKALIVRSNRAGETVAALFYKKEKDFILPQLSENCKGFQIYYSNPLSPTSNPDKLLKSFGDAFLIETIRGRKLKYGALSFFQVYVSMFEKTLEDIAIHIKNAKRVVDCYGGVGAISLSLVQPNQKTVIVESNAEAVGYAKENIALNNLQGAEAELHGAEREMEYITAESTVILDPPRAGLDKKVISELLAKKPKKIIYMSCDLATHARDVAMLQSEYKPIEWKLYNFFPRTSHIEGLCILERK
jgi:23S rRNA (uracil1939-C5)-methyltransferase